jgi:hypothetical protein
LKCGRSNHCPPALGTILMYLLGSRKAFLGESLTKGVFPYTMAHGWPMGVLVISCVEEKAKGCGCGFLQR